MFFSKTRGIVKNIFTKKHYTINEYEQNNQANLFNLNSHSSWGGFAALTLVNQCSCNPKKTHTLNIVEANGHDITQVDLAVGVAIEHDLILHAQSDQQIIEDAIFTCNSLPNGVQLQSYDSGECHISGTPTEIGTTVTTVTCNSKSLGENVTITITFNVGRVYSTDFTTWHGYGSGTINITDYVDDAFMYDSVRVSFESDINATDLFVPEFITDSSVVKKVVVLGKDSDTSTKSGLILSLTLPRSITVINKNACYGTNLTEVNLQDLINLHTIKQQAFYQFNGPLADYCFPSSLQIIEQVGIGSQANLLNLTLTNPTSNLDSAPGGNWFTFMFETDTGVSSFTFKNFNQSPAFTCDDINNYQYMFVNKNTSGTLIIDGGELSKTDPTGEATLQLMKETYGLPNDWTVQVINS